MDEREEGESLEQWGARVAQTLDAHVADGATPEPEGDDLDARGPHWMSIFGPDRDAEATSNTVGPDECAGLSKTLGATCERVLASLTPRERKVLDMRMKATDPPILSERIREIEEKTLRKLRRST